MLECSRLYSEVKCLGSKLFLDVIVHKENLRILNKEAIGPNLDVKIVTYCVEDSLTLFQDLYVAD